MTTLEFSAEDSLTFSKWAIAFTVVALVAHSLSKRLKYTNLPTINNYPFDWNFSRAKAAYEANARELLAEGQRRYPDKPFRVITTLGARVILPRAWIPWVQKHRDLDHQEQVAQEFFGSYPGFEAIGAFNDKSKLTIDVVKSKMGSLNADMIARLYREATDALETSFGTDEEWHGVEWAPKALAITARVSAAVFVGEPLSHDPEWLDLVTSHAVTLFTAARDLRTWPEFLRPVVHWILPSCRRLRAQVREARSRFGNALQNGEKEDSATALGWTRQLAGKRDVPYDPVIIQLALAVGAIHTTAQLLNQAVLDLALAGSTRSDLIKELRDQVKESVGAAEGIPTPAAIARMRLLDACIKETQRLKPGNLVNLDRAAVKDIILPDGSKIAKGTLVAVSSDVMWDEGIWGKNAKAWDPMRFMNATKGERVGVVSSTDTFFAFGLGRFICPGRSLVAAELSVILMALLRHLDLRLAEKDAKVARKKGRVDVMPYGFEMLADSNVGIEVKRRKSLT